ncbi:hypothetical protein UJ101_00900 [Flavobacteriaceae bacterium UJ101]|nr:hypothetical protein UJ101_00900 [Flavobacteriaceae bacterium UJ101]
MNYKKFTKLILGVIISCGTNSVLANTINISSLKTNHSLKNTDWDGDGIPDYRDLDSDNDGISDLIEGGINPKLDQNNDGKIDNPTDTNHNGLADSVDPDNGGAPASIPDTDGDSVPDFRDLDSDNDGINDIDESGHFNSNERGFMESNGSFINPKDLPDTDQDGIPDVLDPNIDTSNLNKKDSDGDGILDIYDGKPYEFGDAPMNTTPEIPINSIEETNNSRITIYPNPTADELNVTPLTKANKYVIYNSNGNVIKKGKIRKNINVSQLPTGLYIIKFSDGSSHKFIKK